MKNSYALIIIVVCIAIAIVGWNGLMKTYTAQSSDNENRDISTSKGQSYYFNKLSEMESEIEEGNSHSKSNPWVIPAGLLVLGVIGTCYGVYSLKKRYNLNCLL